MGIEIERKYLVTGTPPAGEPSTIVQGYLSLDPERTVRVRIRADRAYITVKGISVGAARAEFEYPIPVDDARAMLALAVGSIVEKVRHRIPVGEHIWEVDVFAGANAGLVVAEIELASEDAPFERPGWIGAEVTSDHRYMNARLARTPFSSW